MIFNLTTFKVYIMFQAAFLFNQQKFLNFKMQNIFSSSKAFIITCFFVVAFSSKSFSYNSDLSEDVVKEIESSLLFDKDTAQDIEIYNPSAKKDKSPDIVINRSDVTPDKSSIKIDLIKSDQPLNLSIIEKQTIAYNIALIEQYEASIEIYKQILKSDSNNDYAKFSLAVIYQQIGQLKQAKELYYSLLKKNPENKDQIIENLLAILVEESPKDSIYLLSRLSSQNPNSSYIKSQLALAYDKAKDYQKAVLELNKAIEIEPNKIEYYYNLAVIYDKMSDYENAIQNYYYVVKNYDNSPFISIEHIKKRIESIKSNL